MLGDFLMLSRESAKVTHDRKPTIRVNQVKKAELLIAFLVLDKYMMGDRMADELRKVVDLPEGFTLGTAQLNKLKKGSLELGAWLESQGITLELI